MILLQTQSFKRSARQAEWSGSIRVGGNWRAVLDAEQVGSATVSPEGELMLSWDAAGARSVVLRHPLSLPATNADEALFITVVIVGAKEAEIASVVRTVSLQEQTDQKHEHRFSDLLLQDDGVTQRLICETIFEPAICECRLAINLHPGRQYAAFASITAELHVHSLDPSTPRVAPPAAPPVVLVQPNTAGEAIMRSSPEAHSGDVAPARLVELLRSTSLVARDTLPLPHTAAVVGGESSKPDLPALLQGLRSSARMIEEALGCSHVTSPTCVSPTAELARMAQILVGERAKAGGIIDELLTENRRLSALLTDFES